MAPELDYNLFRVFRVLMEERSVTLAARRLGLTQSSMSNALNRLRAALDDRVLEREGNAMVPTTAALALWERIAGPITMLETEVGRHGQFQPEEFDGTFRIAIEDYALEVAGPRLVDEIGFGAPHAKLAVLPFARTSDAELLVSGDADLAIAVRWQLPPALRTQRLFGESFQALVRPSHPLSGSKPGLDDYLAYPHILVSGRGIVGGNVDAALAPHGLARTVALSLPGFSTAPAFLAKSDCLLNVGSRLAAIYAARFGLSIIDIPVPVPGFELSMVWHPRNTNGSIHRWLRARVEAAFAPL